MCFYEVSGDLRQRDCSYGVPQKARYHQTKCYKYAPKHQLCSIEDEDTYRHNSSLISPSYDNDKPPPLPNLHFVKSGSLFKNYIFATVGPFEAPRPKLHDIKKLLMATGATHIDTDNSNNGSLN